TIRRPLLSAALLGILLFAFAETPVAAGSLRNEDAVRLREIETWRKLAAAAHVRYTHWIAYSETIENERCPGVVGVFNVAARSERVLLYHLNRRLEVLGGRLSRKDQPEYTPCFTVDAAIAESLRLCSNPGDLSLPEKVAVPDTASVEARRAASVTPAMLEWLDAQLRVMRSGPPDLYWWTREYFVCSLCGMPMADLRRRKCSACGADETEFLRIR
ncbi:MAG TPA: hypothetical protein PLY73_15965, partial [Candidatus Ozemobacteraceae bacterium]|nr:hypothetical protein [Candidatus Ozemobacteraceae bacterium]